MTAFAWHSPDLSQLVERVLPRRLPGDNIVLIGAESGIALGEEPSAPKPGKGLVTIRALHVVRSYPTTRASRSTF